MPGLGASFGRGAATTAQWDLANSDSVLIMGSDMAECHPIAFRFVMQAKAHGATVIHVDPRFTRTSAMSNIHVPIRSGSDIAFLGGLIHHVLEHDLWFKDYVLNYTNAAQIIREDFQDTEDLGGVFSGLDRENRKYHYGSWQYAGHAVPPATAEHHVQSAEPYTQRLGSLERHPSTGAEEQDLTLQDPRCVFQILKRHYARYTPEMVASICGCTPEQVVQVAEALAANSGRERTGSVCYAVAWTQHTVGTQMIRAASVLQLLLGNIGRPGGGILALRGHATIQGSTDIPTLYNMLPGYLAMPDVIESHGSLEAYLKAETPETGWWHNLPKYMVSLLKAWYGDAARAGNGYAYDHVPHIDGDYSQQPMMLGIHDGVIKGFLVLGQNPAVGGHNTGLVRRGLANLDWMVVRDGYETETASFWYASPEAKSGELDPHQIKTEIFFLPAAYPGEKEGSFTNTHRLTQWHDKAVEPPADARSDAWFVYHLGRRLRELYAGSTEARDRPLLDLTWDYPTVGALGEPDMQAILREVNGYTWPDRRQVKDFTELKDDGSTACGCWLYSGVYPEEGKNLARNRTPDPDDNPGTHLGWGFSWPANRRILYNRCAADPEGQPWSERKRYIWWDEERGRWVGYDVPDFPVEKAPDYEVPAEGEGMACHSGKDPFIMMADGKGWIYAAAGLKDGPLPAHYEPVESPVINLLYPAQQFNPVAPLFPRPDNRYHKPADPDYPYVITTYRLTEHHTGGVMTRWLPWLAELQPEGFVEISRELAAEQGLESGDWVTLWTARGEVEARVLVTGRLAPLHLDGQVVHEIGMPWHYGYKGVAQGDIANTLSAIVEDPNSKIHEGKAFTCNMRPGRKGERR